MELCEASGHGYPPAAHCMGGCDRNLCEDHFKLSSRLPNYSAAPDQIGQLYGQFYYWLEKFDGWPALDKGAIPRDHLSEMVRRVWIQWSSAGGRPKCDDCMANNFSLLITMAAAEWAAEQKRIAEDRARSEAVEKELHDRVQAYIRVHRTGANRQITDTTRGWFIGCDYPPFNFTAYSPSRSDPDKWLWLGTDGLIYESRRKKPLREKMTGRQARTYDLQRFAKWLPGWA